MSIFWYFTVFSPNPPALISGQKLFQLAAWSLLYLLLLLYSLQGLEHWTLPITRATIPFLSYLAVVYLNGYLLKSVFAGDRRWLKYLLLSVGTLLLVAAIRMTVEYYLLNRLFFVRHFYDFSSRHISFTFITLIIAYIFGILLRTAFNYIDLLQKQEEIKAQRLQAELTLLKAQVQPHFLFNTLNNIYYLAYRKSDKTTELIAKLAELMRYFLTESFKESVPLAVEMQFIRDYIELETIRIPKGLRVDWQCRGDTRSVCLPPMLLMPLVENVFKHGVDKTKPDNWAALSLQVDEHFLRFETRNPVHDPPGGEEGTGLHNLVQRLRLLYGDAGSLSQQRTDNQYIARLKLPLAH